MNDTSTIIKVIKTWWLIKKNYYYILFTHKYIYIYVCVCVGMHAYAYIDTS